ncbi:bile acid:sodium symporter family protein [Nocardiopsis coralliicola]
MTPHPLLRAGSSALLIAGALIPLAASGFTGMALAERPWAAAALVLLWSAGLALGYRAFAQERGRPGGQPAWLRICAYVGASSATLLLLGMVFGFAFHPTVGTSFFGTHFTTVLMVTLAVMGVQITVEDWKDVVRNARVVSLVVVVRWLIMPLTGFCVSFVAFRAFLPEETATPLAIGMMLLCTSPPGAASNSLTLISRGDLALSVSATAINVLVAPFLQPLLIRLFVGGETSVDTVGMFLDLAGYVLAPVVLASLAGALFPRAVARIKPLLAPIAVVSLALVLMGTLSKGAETILGNLAVLPAVLAACIVQGVLGLSLGYYAPKLLGFNRRQRIAASYEVGVENAAIAPALAATYFNPLAIVPAVVYGKTQNLLAAAVFAKKFLRDLERDEARAAEPGAGDPDGAAERSAR